METTMSKSMEIKGAREITKMAGTLSQVLKSLGGLYKKELKGCEGMTVEGWMSAHGVDRINNGAYTPASLKNGWHPAMQGEKGAMYIYKNCVATYKDGRKKYQVYTKAEAEKVDGEPITQYTLKEISANKWSIRYIMNGLVQSNNHSEHNEKAEESSKAWDAIKEVYIIKVDENGQKVVEKVAKSKVTF